MNQPAPWQVPGLAGQPEWLVVFLLSALWAANGTVAAWSAGRGRLAVFAVIDALLLVWLETHLAWRTDSGVVWLWGNVASSLLMAGGLVVALRARLSAEARVSVARFWRMAWPLLLLVLAGNGAVALVREWVLLPLVR